MFNQMIDRGCRWVAGGCVVGEISALFQGNTLQQIGWALMGAATFLSHFAWAQVKERRRNREEDEKSRRRDEVLNALAKRVQADISDRKPIHYPELLHLLLDEGHCEIDAGPPTDHAPAPEAGDQAGK